METSKKVRIEYADRNGKVTTSESTLGIAAMKKILASEVWWAFKNDQFETKATWHNEDSANDLTLDLDSNKFFYEQGAQAGWYDADTLRLLLPESALQEGIDTFTIDGITLSVKIEGQP